MVRTSRRKWWSPASDSQQELFDQFKKEIFSALVPCKEGVVIGSVLGFLKDTLGDEVPYRQIGFRTFGEYLFHLDDILELRAYNPRLFPSHKKFLFIKESALTEKSLHIRNMVEKQLSSKNRRGEPKANYRNTIPLSLDELLTFYRGGSVTYQFGNREPPVTLNPIGNRQPSITQARMLGNCQPSVLYKPLIPSVTPGRMLGNHEPTATPKPLMSSVNQSSVLGNREPSVTPRPLMPFIAQERVLDHREPSVAYKSLMPSVNQSSVLGNREPTATPRPLMPSVNQSNVLGNREPSATPRQLVPSVAQERVLDHREPSVAHKPLMPSVNQSSVLDNRQPSATPRPLVRSVAQERMLDHREPSAAHKPLTPSVNQGSVLGNRELPATPRPLLPSVTQEKVVRKYLDVGVPPVNYKPLTYKPLIYKPLGNSGPSVTQEKVSRIRLTPLTNTMGNHEPSVTCNPLDNSEPSVTPQLVGNRESSVIQESVLHNPESYVTRDLLGNCEPSVSHKPLGNLEPSIPSHLLDNREPLENHHPLRNSEPSLSYQPLVNKITVSVVEKMNGEDQVDCSPLYEDDYTTPPTGENYFDPLDQIEFERLTLGPKILRVGQYNCVRDFMVVNYEAEKRVAEFISDMTGWYNHFKNKLPPVTVVADKGIYSGYDEESRQWLRVQIDLSEEPQEEKMTAFFCDLGKMRGIRLENLRFLKEMHTKLPRQAFFAETNFSDKKSPLAFEEALAKSEGKLWQVNIEKIVSDQSIVPLLTLKLTETETV